MSSPRSENMLLRALLKEAGWSGDGLAAALNALGAENGLRLRYRRPSVAQWLAGSSPRTEVRALLSEAFSRRLGREVTIAEIGLGGAERTAGPSITHEELTRPPVHPTYALEALRHVPTGLGGKAQRPRATAPTRQRLDRAHVTAVHDMAALLSRTDQALGGGTAKQAFTSFFHDVAVPWTGLPARPAIRGELLTQLSQLAYLGGFLYFDEGLQGAAQHYYRLSASLSHEAADSNGLAVALRALSVQARYLGHYRQAHRLAEAAVDTGRRSEPGTVAFLNGQLAVSLAAAGHRKSSLERFTAAELSLSRADTLLTPAIGAYNSASLAHQRAALNRHLGDSRGALAALKEATRLRPPHESRSRALILARQAELELERGHLEAACASWKEFLAIGGGIRSKRLNRAAAIMRASLKPYQKNPAARALLLAP
ncbi:MULTISPECIES: hypothetical protein [Kitasatospora]|uniref:Regulatory protein n=1 Tax=Kitasatospora setae (strain ATCC 33774 / DSM 43861 / JCM 3304 / KCC A-0304 / NBRC 14216 / KM-6054) TaxID=452652 RepID=E4N6C5_KITSK|nr:MULTISPECIES: hypothetical protein [Kitasatospora]BAJ26756.1 hypothetical protein KSE_09190 [Kitasatospora setae KM-6054]